LFALENDSLWCPLPKQQLKTKRLKRLSGIDVF